MVSSDYGMDGQASELLERGYDRFIQKPFDMTDLVQALLKKDEKIGVYPVSQKAYIDIGLWEGYKKYIDEAVITEHI